MNGASIAEAGSSALALVGIGGTVLVSVSPVSALVIPLDAATTSRAKLWRWRHPLQRFPRIGAWLAQDYAPLETLVGNGVCVVKGHDTLRFEAGAVRIGRLTGSVTVTCFVVGMNMAHHAPARRDHWPRPRDLGPRRVKRVTTSERCSDDKS